MKTSCRRFFRAWPALGLTFCLAGASGAQVTVKVDSSKNWLGWMNTYTLEGTYLEGGAWAVGDLRAEFVPAKSNATRVVLRVNTNTYNTADPYWNLPDGTPQKNLEANFYVDVGTAYGGQDVSFVGTVESNSIPWGWTCQVVIKEFTSSYGYVGDSRSGLVDGEFGINRTIGAGNICQYGFMIYGPNTAPESPDSLTAVSVVVDNEDPSITAEPVKQRVMVGQTASFTVVATGSTPLSYQWQRHGTNLTDVAGRFAGATNATLTIYNAQFEDDTSYTVIVTDTAGSVNSVPARLRVLTPIEFANRLDNPSFELDLPGGQVVPQPWVNFTGSTLLSGAEFAYTNAYDGSNVVQVYNGGQYSGIYQDVPAAPGQIFTGDCRLWQSSQDPLSATLHEAFLEVQFWPAAGAPIAIYQSVLVTNSPAMQDAWLHLWATNGVPAGYATTSTSNALYLVAPPGTHHVRFQITAHAEGVGPGSVFVDAMRLVEKIPVTLGVSNGGGNVTLSWPSEFLSMYQVVYKENLTDAEWTPVGAAVAGDGTVKSISFPATGSRRFYAVLTQ